MEELTLATPSILFSAISLIMLAYTNRFLAYANVIRTISAEYRHNPSPRILRQVHNLRRRLYLTRAMQVTGLLSLLLCVVCTLMIYVGWQGAAVYTFAVSLALLVASLAISVREILISVRSLEIHLDRMVPLSKGERSDYPGCNAD